MQKAAQLQFLACLDTKLLDLVEQVTNAHAENLGGLIPVTAHGLERAPDRLAFRLRDGIGQSGGAAIVLNCGWIGASGNVLGPNNAVGAQDRGALDSILQLPDV